MPYPRDDPSNKHDVVGPWPLLPSFSTSCGEDMRSHPLYLPNDDAVLSALDSRLRMTPDETKRWARQRGMSVISNAYTYPDAPTRPKPLSRTLEIMGFVDVASSTLARLLLAKREGAGGFRPGAGSPLDSVMKGCVLAVRRADRSSGHRSLLEREPKKLRSSDQFAVLTTTLRRAGMAAIFGVDSVGRFGVLLPMDAETDEGGGGGGGGHAEGSNDTVATDYAAVLHVGRYDDVKDALSRMPPPNDDYHCDNDGVVAGPGTPQYAPPPDGDGDGDGYGYGFGVGEKEGIVWPDVPGTPPYAPPKTPPPGGDLDHGGGFSTTFGEGADVNGGDNGGGGGLWKPPGADDGGGGIGFGGDDGGGGGGGLWQPPGMDDGGGGGGGGGFGSGDGDGLWQPPGMDDGGGGGDISSGGGFGFGPPDFGTGEGGGMTSSFDAGQKKRSHSDMENGGGRWDGDGGDGNANSTNANAAGSGDDMDAQNFHADAGAAAADAFYTGLTRTLETRGASRLFHMRNFNGWVKATQIAELDPCTKDRPGGRKGTKHPLRILDLACGKGGDLGKWTIHRRGVQNYVGIDVARGSLKDAAIRARKMRSKLRDRCVFTCADLGSDVPGRPRTAGSTKVQKLMSWSMAEESPGDSGDPKFRLVPGGGIGLHNTFDVVSIQFAIHYMMSTRKRAMRFFQTVSQLLEVGGNLVFTTIDSRVVLDHMMDLGLNLHFDDDNDGDENGNGEKNDGADEAVVKVGDGACRLKFDKSTIRKIFRNKPPGERFDPLDPELFGLEYTFTLVEGDDHDAGFGEAVDLPEWLSPLPTLTALAREAGMELEYASNFHEFYHERSDPNAHYAAHSALSNMKVLDRNGSISAKEWEISRMYMAVKFRKVTESRMVLEEEDVGAKFDEAEPETEQQQQRKLSAAEIASIQSNPKAKKMLPKAMMKAKANAGDVVWQALDGDEKRRRMNDELIKMLS